MKDIQEASEKICELKGELIALQVFADALVRSLPPHVVQELLVKHEEAAEIARVTLINSDRVGESVLTSFDLHIQNWSSMVRRLVKPN